MQSNEAQTATTNSIPNGVDIDPDDEEDEEGGNVHLTGMRFKASTSNVWKYFTKQKEIVEVNGQKYEQL